MGENIWCNNHGIFSNLVLSLFPTTMFQSFHSIVDKSQWLKLVQENLVFKVNSCAIKVI